MAFMYINSNLKYWLAMFRLQALFLAGISRREKLTWLHLFKQRLRAILRTREKRLQWQSLSLLRCQEEGVAIASSAMYPSVALFTPPEFEVDLGKKTCDRATILVEANSNDAFSRSLQVWSLSWCTVQVQGCICDAFQVQEQGWPSLSKQQGSTAEGDSCSRSGCNILEVCLASHDRLLHV